MCSFWSLVDVGHFLIIMFFVAELFKETSWIKLLFFDWTILDLYPHHERLLFEALAGLASAWPEPRCMIAPRRTQVPGCPRSAPEGRSKRSSNWGKICRDVWHPIPVVPADADQDARTLRMCKVQMCQTCPYLWSRYLTPIFESRWDKIRWDRTTYSCTHNMLYLESYTATAAHQSRPRRYDISLVTFDMTCSKGTPEFSPVP